MSPIRTLQDLLDLDIDLQKSTIEKLIDNQQSLDTKTLYVTGYSVFGVRA